MDGSFMTTVEQQHYSELFSKSDVDNTGKVATSHVRTLFLSSQLPMETLQQIVELCGAARVGHFGRSQFYFALKLIAMAQNGLPLPPSIDKINTAVEVPLPAFASNWGTDVSDPNRQMEFINPAFIDNAPEQEVDYDYPPIKQDPPAEWSGSGGFRAGGIPPPQRNSRPGNALYQVANSPQANPQPQPQVQVQVQPQVQPQIQNTSTSPPSSPKPTSSPFQNSTPPTSPPHGRSLERHKSLPSSPRDVIIKDINRHSVDIIGGTPVKIPTKDEGWASFDEEKQEQNNHNQAPPQPHSGDEDTSWAKFPDQSGGDQPELKHSVSIPGSEGSVSEEDVWQISSEQRTYYTNQFQRLQPEPCGLLGGAEAKGFFEKSKLPTTELSIIWQLSDVNKDGTLSLEEFCTAMHLVVLRKHSIALPDKLPACLVPQVGAPTAEEKEVTYKSGKEKEGGSTEQTSVPAAPRSVTPPVENNKAAKTKDENWAKFNDSPLPRPPSPSSQSPANFDFASISPDPEAKIFQPIPLHVSPSGNRSVVIDTEQRARTHSDPIRQDSSSDHEYDVPPPTLPEKKKRANTMTSESSTPAKIAPPPPIEKSRRGDSLERNSDMGHHLRPSIPPRPGAQKTYPSQTSKSSSVQSSAASSSSVSDSSSHSSSAEDDDEDNHTADFADFSKFESMTADSPTPEDKQNRVVSAKYTPVDSTPRLSPPPPPPPRQQTLEDSCTDKHFDKSSFLASKERHKSGDELQADRKREQFAHERTRHASAPDPVTSTQVQDYDRKSIQAAIRRAKEENTKLSRLNSELQQELKQMMEDRIALETQLERLRPFSSTS